MYVFLFLVFSGVRGFRVVWVCSFGCVDWKCVCEVFCVDCVGCRWCGLIGVRLKLEMFGWNGWFL